MFAEDQARIQRWCKNPDKFLSVGTMVLLSIRMQWVGVGNQMADVRRRGHSSKCLWGFKRDGYLYLRRNRRALYAKVRDRRAGRISLRDLMREFLKVPGLGLPKAGFLCQLLVGEAGCLDMHNVARFGLDESAWSIRRLRNDWDQMQEIDNKIDFYLRLCETCGGAEKLWDEWCVHLNEQVGTFHSPDDVSRRHYIYLLDLPGD